MHEGHQGDAGTGQRGSRPLPAVSPMREVEVWSTFSGRWVGGFWLDHLDPLAGVFLRRSPDGVVIGPVDPTRLRQRPDAERTEGWAAGAAGNRRPRRGW